MKGVLRKMLGKLFIVIIAVVILCYLNVVSVFCGEVYFDLFIYILLSPCKYIPWHAPRWPCTSRCA